MFQRVYFAPRKKSIKTFTDIAANPAFAQNVEELIYDGRLFLPKLGTFSYYFAAFDERVKEELALSTSYVRNPSLVGEAFAKDVYQNSMWNGEILGTDKLLKTVVSGDSKAFRANVAESLFRYACLLQQQESIFTKAEDLKALSEGLNAFRKITKVGVVVDFRHHLEYDLYAGDRHDQYIEHHQWYSSRSYTEFGFALPPSKWWIEPLFDDLELLGYSKWDVRGVLNLFRAISIHRPRLKELRIGSMHCRAPTTIFSLSDNEIEETAAMARGLTTLRLHSYVNDADGSSEHAKQHRGLRRLLQEAKGLHNLSTSNCVLHYEGSDTAADVHEELFFLEYTNFPLSLGKQWPHLTKLTLKDTFVTVRDLMMIFRFHTESLRELSLMKIHLLGEETWEHVGTEIGQILELHSVCISQLYNKLWTRDYTWPQGEQGFVLIRNLMQWAHPDELEIEENHGTFPNDHFMRWPYPGEVLNYSIFIGRLKASLR